MDSLIADLIEQIFYTTKSDHYKSAKINKTNVGLLVKERCAAEF